MSKKKKVLRINKSSKNVPGHIIAIARAKAHSAQMNHANDDPNSIVFGEQNPNNVIMIPNMNDVPKKVSKSEFYSFRDKVYKILTDSGKDYTGLPGNPFGRFSHGVIKDSIVKNYRNELIAFKETVKQFFPEVYNSLNNDSVLANRENKNSVPLDLNVEDTLKEVSSEYIQMLYAKQQSGMTLSKAEQNILRAYEKLQGELRSGAKRQIQNDVGAFVSEHIFEIVLILIVIIFLIKKR